jgi:hypothetical protein
MGPVKPATITNTTEVAEAPPVVGGCVYPSRNPRPRTLAIVFPRNSDTGYNYYYRGIRVPGCSIVRIRRPRIGATRVYPHASAALPPLHVADRHGNTPLLSPRCGGCADIAPNVCEDRGCTSLDACCGYSKLLSPTRSDTRAELSSL